MHGGAGTNGRSGGTIPEMGAEGGPALCYCISCWDGGHTFGEAGREGSETAVWKTVTGTFREAFCLFRRLTLCEKIFGRG